MKISTFWFWILFAASAYAQEVQVPLDSAGTLNVVTPEIARRIGIFSDYPNFLEARLYQQADSGFVLEIEYQPEQQVLKKREPMTPEAVEVLRNNITRRMRAEMPYGLPDQEGRAKLLVGTTILGLTYYGWAIPAMTQVQDGKAAVALYLLTSGSSFLIPLLITNHAPVSRADASAALYGGWRGIPHGILMYAVLAGDKGTDQGVIGSGMVGSVGEMIAAYQWAHHSHLTPGTVSAIAACGDLGMVFGGATGLLLIGNGSDNAEPGFADGGDRAFKGKVRGFSAATLAGAAGGIMLGNVLASRQVYTKGDGYVLRELGILAIGAAISVADIANMHDSGVDLVLMAGSASGIILGHRLTRNVNFSASQGTLIGLSELGGALFGFGIAVLADATDSAPYITLATIGAAGGFALSYHAFSRSARAPSHSLLDLEISPQGLMTYDAVGHRRLAPGVGAVIRF